MGLFEVEKSGLSLISGRHEYQLGISRILTGTAKLSRRDLLGPKNRTTGRMRKRLCASPRQLALFAFVGR